MEDKTKVHPYFKRKDNAIDNLVRNTVPMILDTHNIPFIVRSFRYLERAHSKLLTKAKLAKIEYNKKIFLSEEVFYEKVHSFMYNFLQNPEHIHSVNINSLDELFKSSNLSFDEGKSILEYLISSKVFYITKKETLRGGWSAHYYFRMLCLYYLKGIERPKVKGQNWEEE